MASLPLRHALGVLTSLSVTAYDGSTTSFTAFEGTTPHDAVQPRTTPAPRDTRRATPAVVGLIQDTTGAPLPNVQVVVGGTSRATTTDAHGRFVIRSLPAGTYHFDARLIGYAPAHAVVTVPAVGDEVLVTMTMRPTPLRLSNVQVTATPTGTDPHEITQSTIELSGRELARNLGANVAQTLSSEPGMSTRYAGPAATLPVIRGLTGDRILILQDGGRAADLSSSSSDHGLSVDPLTASRIEVVRGPASLLYGNNALGGVVNVISNDIPTSVPTHLEGYAAAQAESVNPGGAGSGALTVPLGNAGAFTVRGGGRRIDDVRIGGGAKLVNSFSRNFYGVAGLGYVTDRLTGGLAYRGYRFRYGLPAPSGDPEVGARIEGTRHQVSARGDFDVAVSVISHVRADASAQWYQHDELERTGEVATSFSLLTQTVNLLGNLRYGPVDGAIGVSGLLKQYDPRGDEALTPGAKSDNAGVFVFQRIPVGREPVGDEPAERARVAHVEVGGRFDYYRIRSEAGDSKFGPARTRDFRSFSGSLGLNVPLGNDYSLGLSVARAFRAPTVEELFSNAFHAALGSYDMGNPELRSETSRGAEAVLRAQRARLVAQLSVFYNRIDDFITPVVVGDTLNDEGERVPMSAYVQDAATLRGAEAQLEAEVARGLVLGAMADVLRGTFSGGAPLPFMPAARLGGSVRWDNGRYSVGAEVRHAFAQDLASAREASGELATKAYTLVMLSAGVNVIRGPYVHSLTLRADNLLDEEYREATSRIKAFAPNPGRNLTLVYRVLF